MPRDAAPVRTATLDVMMMSEITLPPIINCARNSEVYQNPLSELDVGKLPLEVYDRTLDRISTQAIRLRMTIH